MADEGTRATGTSLLERLPGLEPAVPAEELRRREGLRVGGLEKVPVRW